MLPQYDLVPIPLDASKIPYLTQLQLVGANDESIRLGFSRNLVEEKIADLPADLNFPIVHAWDHTSGEGLKNIRLGILIGPHGDDLNQVILDVTSDTWAKLHANPAFRSQHS
jgi:hypothetical protein